MAERNTPTVEDLKAPLLAVLGAADLGLEQVNEFVTSLRERANEARTDATTRIDETRERLTKLQEDLPQRTKELRARLNADELRQTAETYRGSATEQYKSLVERGETVLEQRRKQPKKAPAQKAVAKKASAKKVAAPK